MDRTLIEQKAEMIPSLEWFDDALVTVWLACLEARKPLPRLTSEKLWDGQGNY